MSTVLYRRQGDQLFDSNGNPLAGGKLTFYQAGTSILQATYSDAAGTVPNTNPVILNGAGRLTTAIYLGSSYDYKELLTDSLNATVAPWPFDNIPKAPVTVSTANYALTSMPWSVVSVSSVALTAADAGKGYECNTAANNVTVYLPSASTVGSGKGFTFKKTAAANTLTLDGYAAETINGAAAIEITRINDCLQISSDGAAWNIVSSSIPTIDFPSAIPTPTSKAFGSGSGTVAPTAGVVWWHVRMVGGGGGGGGAAVGPGAGGTGGTTSLGSWTAIGGGGGGASVGGFGGAGGAGGAAGTGTGIYRASGQAGSSGSASIFPIGGAGGSSLLGAGGSQLVFAAAGQGGVGFGGGGGGAAQTVGGIGGGGGGGSGEFVEFIVNNPTATSYVVGAAGTAGAGTTIGGGGASGAILITEFYS